MCTAQPVNQDYSPFDPVKSMCDPFMFNTIVTRPKSLLVVIGNPFRLLKIEQMIHLGKIEQKTPIPPACWSEYLYQCWEGGSLQLSTKLKEAPGACKKELVELDKELILYREHKHTKVKGLRAPIVPESDLTLEFIQKYYGKLCELLDVAAIAGKLFSKKIIDFVQKQEIVSKGSTQEANATFADYLYRHANKDTLETFLQILEKDPQYPKHKDLGAAMRKDWAELLSASEVSGHPLHVVMCIV